MQAVKKKAEGKESLCYDASGLNILVWLTLLPQKFFLRWNKNPPGKLGWMIWRNLGGVNFSWKCASSSRSIHVFRYNRWAWSRMEVAY